MNDDIPFDKNLTLAPDAVDEPVPGVRRVMANNPGPFTFKGTVSYILGRGKVAIVDPGPDDPAHVGALLDAVRGEAVTHIFVTHTHRDHSPAVPAIKAATVRPSVPRVHIVRRGPCISASSIRSMPVPTAISVRTLRSRMVSTSAATAGPLRPWRRRAIPPITWLMRSRRRTYCLPAIT